VEIANVKDQREAWERMTESLNLNPRFSTSVFEAQRCGDCRDIGTESSMGARWFGALNHHGTGRGADNRRPDEVRGVSPL
jgi:hypothetical protein